MQANFDNKLSIEIEFSLDLGEWYKIEKNFINATHSLIKNWYLQNSRGRFAQVSKNI